MVRCTDPYLLINLKTIDPLFQVTPAQVRFTWNANAKNLVAILLMEFARYTAEDTMSSHRSSCVTAFKLLDTRMNIRTRQTFGTLLSEGKRRVS